MDAMTMDNRDKFKELIKYIAAQSINDVHFGATKLNKLLFYCDFYAYKHLGKSISGEGYHKEPYGPVPHHIKKVIKEMKENGEITEAETPLGRYIQKTIVTTQPVNYAIFLPQEISLIDNVINKFEETSATDVSELSHDFIGWKLAEMGEDIPYEVVLLEESSVTDDDIEYGKELLKNLNNESVMV